MRIAAGQAQVRGAGDGVFGLVRWRTGSFVYSALTPWIVVGPITLAVWAL